MAENYVLVTDSACDILPDKLAEWNVQMIPLAFLFTDTGREQKDHEEPIEEFYASMRAGRVAKTSCVNEDAFAGIFTPILEAGQDILYLGFSSGLSATCENGKKVAAAMAAKYPERKIKVIDSLAASAGEGLFVYLAVRNRDAGMTLEENAEALENDFGQRVRGHLRRTSSGHRFDARIVPLVRNVTKAVQASGKIRHRST